MYIIEVTSRLDYIVKDSEEIIGVFKTFKKAVRFARMKARRSGTIYFRNPQQLELFGDGEKIEAVRWDR